MHNRKITGILKYSKREYKDTTPKLQSGGGFTAHSKGYNWREDPYELMLLRNKFKQDRATTYSDGISGRKSSRSSGSTAKDPKFEGFTSITEGLPGMRDAADNQYKAAQQDFLDKLNTNGAQWIANGAPGQLIYQELVRHGVETNARLKGIAKDYNELYKTLSPDDKNTLAISASNNMIVQDKNGFRKISLEEYVKSPSEFVIKTISDLDKFQRENNVSTDISEEFLKQGAVSQQSYYDRFIKPNADILQYKISEGQFNLRENGKEDRIIEIGTGAQVRSGINNMIHGKNFYEGMSVDNNITDGAIRAAVTTVFEDIMTSVPERSILSASLTAEILNSRIHKDKIKAMKDPQERAAYLIRQRELLLVSKVIDKNRFKSGGESTQGSPSSSMADKVKPRASEITVGMTQIVDGSDHLDTYAYGENVEGGKVMVMRTPALKNQIGADKLKVSENEDMTADQRKQNKVIGNSVTGTNFKVQDIYLVNGTKADDLLSGDELTEFKYNLFIAPQTGIDIVYLPVEDGKLVMHKYAQFKDIKISTRRSFRASYKKRLGKELSTPADKLFKGRVKGDKEYLLYQSWVKMGADVPKYKALAENGGTKEDWDNYALAKDAGKAVAEGSKVVARIFSGKTKLKAFGKITTLLPNVVDFKNKYNESFKGTYAGDGVSEINRGRNDNYIDDTMNVDKWNLWGWFDDDRVVMDVFVELKSQGAIAASEEGTATDIREAKLLNDIDNKVSKILNQNFIGSNRTLKNVAGLLAE